jgi:hypothetical protein
MKGRMRFVRACKLGGSIAKRNRRAAEFGKVEVVRAGKDRDGDRFRPMKQQSGEQTKDRGHEAL